MIEIPEGIDLYIYPGNSILGSKGTIEKRKVVKIDDNKVYYAEALKNGYIGAKRSSAFLTESQAKLKRDEDVREEISRAHLEFHDRISREAYGD